MKVCVPHMTLPHRVQISGPVNIPEPLEHKLKFNQYKRKKTKKKRERISAFCFIKKEVTQKGRFMTLNILIPFYTIEKESEVPFSGYEND